MDLNEIMVFTKVVEIGSFNGAAKSLEMPNSTVSAKVSELESRLGVILIKRTTRKLSVTEDGRKFYERCMKSLEEIRAAEAEITSGQTEPSGLLRITAPIELGIAVLPEVMTNFRKLFPKVRVDLNLSDRSVDLIAEGFDLAIRAGDLKDSSLTSKKLGSVYFAVFASAQYLKKNASPRTPKDLENHCCLQFAPLGTDQWTLSNGRNTATVKLKREFLANEITVVKQMVLNGLGIALLPTFVCLPEVQSGKLVRLLPEWKTLQRPIHFVYPGQRQHLPKVNAFIDSGTEIIRANLKGYEF